MECPLREVPLYVHNYYDDYYCMLMTKFYSTEMKIIIYYVHVL